MSAVVRSLRRLRGRQLLDPDVLVMHFRLGLIPDELELPLKLKIAVRLRGAGELVAGYGGVERPADDGPVLDAPRLGGVALPPGEGLAVEEGLLLGANRARDECDGQEGG